MERPEIYSTSRCNNSTYLCGPSQYPISREAVRAQNGKLRKFGYTSRHGTVFAPRKYFYQKKATGMERPEIYSTSRCNNSTYLCGPSQYPISREAVWPRTEGCLNWDGPTAMVPCLHQGNIYTKRKLRAWRDKKCVPLVSAITPLTCAGRQNTPSRGRRSWPRMESCLNWDGPIAIEPCLYQGNIYTKRKLRAWRDQKCIPLVGAITQLTCAGRQNTPSRWRRYRAQNESSLNLDGPIAMVPCLHQANINTKRKLRAWRDQKCIPLVGAITLLTCAGHESTPP